MNRLVLVIAAGALVAGTVALATAERSKPGPKGKASADCRVREILANRGTDHIDDRVSDLRPVLGKPPVSAWQHFDLLSDSRLRVHGGQGRVQLSDNTELSVVGSRVMIRNDLGAVVMGMSVRFDDKTPQFFGGQQLEDGSQLLVIECK